MTEVLAAQRLTFVARISLYAPSTAAYWRLPHSKGGHNAKRSGDGEGG